MRRLLGSDLELVVESDFIYLPLLFDPEIEKETQALLRSGRPLEKSGQPGSKTIIQFKDRHFVKALRIASLLENYKAINAYAYKRIRNDCLRKYQLTREVDDILLDGMLRTILFRVMPYFITIFKLPENGLHSGQKLLGWLHEAIHAKVLASEHNRIAETLKVRERFSQAKPEHIATLLYIADIGSLEIDGFGFTRNNSHQGEYLVYKRTGDYVLKDYYARSYLFPDCRVAFSTYSPFMPFVMEKYKHPFLLRHKSGQEICMRDFKPSKERTAKNVIRTLEEGLTALRYGYDSRRRNGYHSLDKTWVYIPTIEFEDYRI
jgi:hypothetical protein